MISSDRSFQYMPSINHLVGNIVQIMTDDFRRIFPKDFFKEFKVSTELPAQERRDFKKALGKRKKPFLVVHPDFDINNDSEFYPNRAEEWMNPIIIDNSGIHLNTNNLYSLVQGNGYQVYVRTRRFVVDIEFNIFLDGGGSENRVLSYLTSHIRHAAPYSLEKYVLNHIPENMLKLITEAEGYEYNGSVPQEVFDKINTQASTGIQKTLRGGSGLEEYFTVNKESIMILWEDAPSKERKTIGRINSQTVITEKVRVEFSGINDYLILYNDETVSSIPENSEDVDGRLVYTALTKALPADSLEGKELYLSFDVSLDSATDNVINLVDMIDSFEDSELYSMMKEYYDNNLPLDFIKLEVWKDSAAIVPTFDNYTITIDPLDVDVMSSYTISLYVDTKAVNEWMANRRGVYNDK